MIRSDQTDAQRLARKEEGLTLIEVLAAMIILALGILALAPLMTLSVTGNRFASEVTAVAARAQEDMEQRLRRGLFGTLPYEDSASFSNNKFVTKSLVRDETVDASIPSRLYQIDVTVTWEDDVGVPRTMTFTSFSPKP
jgi:prepilin-type N-terminal cleavage/methylation domain-containing protein